MARIRFALGAEADVVTPSELGSAITGLQGHIDKSFAKKVVQPIRRTITRSNVMTNVPFGSMVANLVTGSSDNTPAVGRLWVVRSVVVYDSAFPLNTTSLNAITGAFCVGDPAAASPADMRGMFFIGIPTATTFNSSSMRVDPNETIYIACYGSVPTSLAFNVEVDEWIDTEFQSQAI